MHDIQARDKGARKRILVVDDESSVVELLRYNFNKEGFDVISALNGRDALGMLLAGDIDAAVLDIMLPEMSGIDVFLAMKASPLASAIPVVFLTARTEEEDRVRGIDIGADDYITKPFAVKELMSRVKAAIRRAESLRNRELQMREMSHRVKNNFMVVQSLLRRQSKDVDDEKSRSYLADCENRIKSMSMIHERLHQSRDIKTVEPAEYIKSLAEGLFGAYKAAGANVSLTCDVRQVGLDADKLMPIGLIINELVSNALKYSFPQGRRGVIAISLKSSGESGAMVLSVKDNGIGMPDDMDIYKTKSLGMWIVTALTGQLKGTLELIRGGGTEFKITFGRPSTAASIHSPAAKRGAFEDHARRLGILLVEDDAINQMMIVGMIRKEGHEAYPVSSAEVAMEALRAAGADGAGKFDLVLMDIHLPGIDGYEAARFIRSGASGEANAQVPIIAVSGLDSDEDRAEIKRAGMDGLISKPVDIRQLRTALMFYSAKPQAGGK